MHEGSYDSSSQDIPVLRGTGQDIFSSGHRAPRAPCLDDTSIPRSHLTQDTLLSHMYLP
jgi:hypothetical protein